MQQFENWYGDEQHQSLRYFHGSMGFSVKSGCRKLPPKLSKSASGSRCGVVSMLTQDAEFAWSGGKSPLFWRMITVAGRKRQVQSLPLSARFWKRAGSQVRQVSGRRRTPELPSTVLCSRRRRLSTVPPKIWRCNHGRMRLGTRSAQAWSKVS